MNDLKSEIIDKYYIKRSKAFRLPEQITQVLDKNGVSLNRIPYTQNANNILEILSIPLGS